jgi:cobalt/nickel transport system permease protein
MKETAMHIPGHTLDPAVAAATNLAAVALTSYAAYRWYQDRKREPVSPFAVGLTTAAILAAQAVNFPISSQVSGHILGGVAAAFLLGTWRGVGAVTLALVAQCLAWHDGGIDALGANVLNMAGIGCVLGGLLRRFVADGGVNRTSILRTAVVSWFSVVLAAVACSAELTIGAAYSRSALFVSMLSSHALIGMGEAVVTTLVVALTLSHAASGAALHTGALRRRRYAILSVAIVTAAVWTATPYASSLPDGLENALAVAGPLSHP